ncbi:hypothetical protein SEPCBS57363_003066 [Sporothrix epigloea]|uniref:Centromere protein H C-terminal domain-containing protein n=1 Tax=Sporothrix epigloea TaxID=1892477 RepID=A0ABP0DJE8_9PEZI
MEQEARPITRDDLHATYLERSIRELQRAVQEEEGFIAELNRALRTDPVPESTAPPPNGFLYMLATAYEAVSRSEPFLPFADSVLPALLALRKTHGVTAESLACLDGRLSCEDLRERPIEFPLSTAAFEQARKKLAEDKARLEDQRALQIALEARIAALRSSLESRSSMTAVEQRQEVLDALHAKKCDYDRDTTALLKALKAFIHDRLGPMLAAEELGGPIVSGMMDIEDGDLAAGFRSKGIKRKRLNNRKSGKFSKPTKDQRQRRIDEMWISRAGAEGGEDEGGEDEGGSEDEDSGSLDEATAAAAELQELTEELLNATASAEGDGSAAYVTIARESAAARFLVRSKVAHFHPRDATRLRLHDFGRELDD